MKKIINILTLFFLPVYCSAQMADSVKDYVDTALTILKNNSLYSKRIDWPAVEKQVYQKASQAKNKTETFEALKIAFDALGDKHAAYYQYDDQYKIEDTALMLRYSDSIKAAWKKGPTVTNRMIDDIAYISIPYMGVGKQELIDQYANWIYETVAKLALNNPEGWIIDLRLNGGGNIRPMLAGMAMFFTPGIKGYYLDPNDTATEALSFRDGDFQIEGITQAAIKQKIPGFKNIKVAVLIGAGTGSSGEGVAVTFQQRKNTRLIGETTAGRANATNGFVFNNNRSYFLISVARLGDEKKKPLPEYVTPDIAVINNDEFYKPEADNAIKAAVKWIKK